MIKMQALMEEHMGLKMKEYLQEMRFLDLKLILILILQNLRI